MTAFTDNEEEEAAWAKLNQSLDGTALIDNAIGATLREAVGGKPFTRVLSHPGPGEKCPQCERRVPHTRKETSPRETHPLTFGRAPTDIVDELKERLSALAVDAGLEPLPFYQARVVMMLLELGEAVDKDVLGQLAAGMSWGTGKVEE